MRKNYTKSTGHIRGNILGVLTLAILFLAGTGIVFIKGSNNDQTSSAAAATETKPSPTAKPIATDAVKAKPGEPQPYLLEVKEWGLSIPLPDSLKDAYYIISTNSADADGTPNTIWVGLKSVDKCAADKANKGGKALASITRTGLEETDPVQGKKYTDLYPNGVTIGNYYYAYTTWSIGNDCTTADTFKRVDADFKPTIKKAAKSRNQS